MKKKQVLMKLDKLIEALLQKEKEQSREEMHQNIMKASNKKILRRQIEMLTEYSRTCGIDRSPEANEAIASLYWCLLKAKCFLFVKVLVACFCIFYIFKSIVVKGAQFIKG